MDPQDDYERWRLAEAAALQAEAEIAGIGQGASDPRFAQLLARARQLREEADAILDVLLQRAGARPPRERDPP